MTTLRYFTLFLALAVTTTLSAQDKGDAYMSEAAEAVCECYQAKENPSTASERQMLLGTCMIQHIEKDRAKAEAALGPIDYNNSTAMTRIGERLGVKMLEFCPDIIMALAGESMQGEEETETPAKEASMTATLSSLPTTDPAMVRFVSADGRPVDLLWLEFFPGADLLNTMAVGKKFTIQYATVDIFSGKTGEYVTRRVIKSLKVAQ
ncbi:hypothetical protein [Lewinella sp. W8]|uniref:hypothetical protein n=1 Tax=Lewinella sp. W8 TaxID=2528208 RepID=UPI00106742D8|nr:hypothetical protein [Lewinella sp. W8]MTB52006.1 hypothetical protein [Lewinella sp. W8]